MLQSIVKLILKLLSTLRWVKTWLQSTYERYFDLLFHFKADQNLVAEHNERDFDLIFPLYGCSKLGCRLAL